MICYTESKLGSRHCNVHELPDGKPAQLADLPSKALVRSKIEMFEQYAVAIVFALIGIPFLWAYYQFTKIPPKKRPRLGGNLPGHVGM